MAEMTVHQVSSIHGFVARILEEQGESAARPGEGPTWYRGSGDSRDQLRPQFYRDETKSAAELQDIEEGLVERFKQRSLPYVTSDLSRSRDCLFFMQHARIPTRLLDWTENPLVALFFALTSSRAGTDPVAQSAVWLLRPVLWNKPYLDGIGQPPRILFPAEAILDDYWDAKADNVRNAPVAVYGTHNSARIAAQKGTFVVFSQTSNAPMESRLNAESELGHTMLRIEIPSECVHDMRRDLFTLGITEAMVYPDLEGLAREFCRDSGLGG